MLALLVRSVKRWLRAFGAAATHCVGTAKKSIDTFAAAGQIVRDFCLNASGKSRTFAFVGSDARPQLTTCLFWTWRAGVEQFLDPALLDFSGRLKSRSRVTALRSEHWAGLDRNLQSFFVRPDEPRQGVDSEVGKHHHGVGDGDRTSAPMVSCNGGLHFDGIVAVPPRSRLKGSLADHFETTQTCMPGREGPSNASTLGRSLRDTGVWSIAC
jgi:hypothetical protein